MSNFNPTNFKNYPLFKKFWETPEPQAGEEDDGLAHRGLGQVSAAGADRLVQFAKLNELDGTPSAAEERKIDESEQALMKHLIEHDQYGAFIGPDARPKLYEGFGIDPGEVHPTEPIHRPQKAGTVTLPEKVSKHGASQLANVDATKLPQIMAEEYSSRKTQLAGANLSEQERGALGLGLLKDYAQALWARGETPKTEKIGAALLEAFSKFHPDAVKLGGTDFSGIGFGAAQSLVLGADINRFRYYFPEAQLTAPTTSLSMNGGMVAPMKHVDAYNEALGRPTGAAKLEEGSPLGWMLGEESGHTKRGNLTESKAFSTSGLNWGVLMFPNDAQIRKLPPKAGFDMAIDCMDAIGNFVSARPDHGDRIKVVDKDGQPVKLEKVIHEGADGKPESWSAIFKNASGEEIPASEVTGLIVTASGQVKGDGKTTKSADMWWWGFCDRNTAQKVYKSKFRIPEIDRETVKIKAGSEIISIPKADAQKLLDTDVPDIAKGETFTGFRFNDEPQYVVLKNGEQLRGKVQGLALEAGPATDRLEGDYIAIHDGPGRPMLGTLEVKTDSKSEYPDVRNIDRIEKDADGKTTVHLKAGWPSQYTGELPENLPWHKAETVDGKSVLKQGEDFPIRGGFTIQTAYGERRVQASEVSSIVGETQKDMRISQLIVWTTQNEGMFAFDASPGIVVSNGPRWMNKVDLREETGDERPSWAPSGALTGLHGELVREEGDKIVYARAMYAYNSDAEPTSSLFEGWYQVGKDGQIKNEGFTSGQPDFGWSAIGPLDWMAPSSFNKFVDPKMRIALLVNGVSNLDDAEAKRLNLPSNWKSYRVDQD